MPTVWPVSIPQHQGLGVTDSKDNALLVSPMDNGTFKSRRKTRTPRRFMVWEMDMNGADRVALETFFDTTLLNGSLTFNMADAVTDTVVQWRFINRPKFMLAVGAPVGSHGLRIWKTKIELEYVGAALA